MCEPFLKYERYIVFVFLGTAGQKMSSLNLLHYIDQGS